MLSYRTVLLAQTGICSGIHPMALSSLPHQLPASGNIRTKLKAGAATFKERDTNLDADKKAGVSKTFKQVKIHKATGPDGSPGRVLGACADQLARVFTDIFNLSLTLSIIPTCFKQTTIILRLGNMA
jgi:hypothetical protein